MQIIIHFNNKLPTNVNNFNSLLTNGLLSKYAYVCNNSNFINPCCTLSIVEMQTNTNIQPRLKILLFIV